MHSTTQKTQSTPVIISDITSSSEQSLLPVKLKQLLKAEVASETHDASHLSKGLSRLLDATGDCV